MPETLYKASQVDPAFQQLLDLIDQVTQVAKEAAARADKAETALAVAQKSSAAPRVTLEKVASFDEQVVNQTLDILENNGMIDEDGRAEIAAQLKTDPNYALKVAAKIALFNAPAHAEGRGVKAASSTPGSETSAADPDGWGEVVDTFERTGTA